MKRLWWVVLGIVAVVLILFAVSNRQRVSVSLWPLPDLVEMPLYLVLLGTLLIGFVVGELTGWIGGWRWRGQMHARYSRRRRNAKRKRPTRRERAPGSFGRGHGDTSSMMRKRILAAPSARCSIGPSRRRSSPRAQFSNSPNRPRKPRESGP